MHIGQCDSFASVWAIHGVGQTAVYIGDNQAVRKAGSFCSASQASIARKPHLASCMPNKKEFKSRSTSPGVLRCMRQVASNTDMVLGLVNGLRGQAVTFTD